MSEQFKIITATTWTPTNVNAQCEVTLTDFGMSHLESIKGRCYCGVYEGTRLVRASLWALMHDFGPSMVFGSMQVPFVDNTIFVRAED